MAKRTTDECLDILEQIEPIDNFARRVDQTFDTKHYAFKLTGSVIHICSKCGHENRLKSHPGEMVKCKSCGADVKVVHTRKNMVRRNLAHTHLINTVRKHEGMFVHVRYEAYMSFDNNYAHLGIKPVEVIVLDGKDLNSCAQQYDWYRAKTVWVGGKLNFGLGRWFTDVQQFNFYPESMKEFLTDTDLKYTCMGVALDESEYNHYDVMYCLQHARRYPFIEFIWKTGNKSLYWSMMTNGSFRNELKYVVKHHRELFKFQIRNASEMMLLANVYKMGEQVDQEIIENLRETNYQEYLIDLYPKVRQSISFKKFIKYFSQLKNVYKYRDYVSVMEKLGTPVNETTMFPKDLEKAHDDATDKFNAIQHEKDNSQYQLRYGQLKKLAFKSNGLCMIVPSDVGQILKEGDKLKHCVGSYVDDVVNGKTTILFVRKADNPEVPFYTLEFKNDRITQCRGYRNEKMTAEVERFTEDWLKWVNRKKRKPQPTQTLAIAG